MPFKKFKPLKQWGRFNARVFKQILKARNKKEIPQPHDSSITKLIQRTRVTVEDPLDPGFFKQFEEEEKQHIAATPTALYNKAKEVHALFKEKECFLFEGTNSFTDGIDQACALIRATTPSAIPTTLLNAIPNNFLPTDFDKHVADCLMAGERFDPSLDTLPRKFDPLLFWITQKKVYGTPVLKRNNIILQNLCMKIALFYMRHELKQYENDRCDYDEAISSYLTSAQSGIGIPLVFRHQPHIVLQSTIPISPLADRQAIEGTIDEEVPNVYPISPLIDLDRTNIYNDTVVLPRLSNPDLKINTILWAREQSQKYPWTMEENAANTICHCFGAALAQALRIQQQRNHQKDYSEAANHRDDASNDEIVLKKPIVAKAVQLVDGKMDLAIVQLNTLDLNQKKDSVKNLVWLDKACPLYKPKPMHENMTEVEELNMDTVNKFVALLLYR